MHTTFQGLVEPDNIHGPLSWHRRVCGMTEKESFVKRKRIRAGHHSSATRIVAQLEELLASPDTKM